ncbi:substrate-binding domain-containing protein [Arboricoccus pini]|uniref:substrate-binding domain-containing protein n=1 Tax=Arboricoccus pini TaxID=1963835 RepID=UPI000B5143E4
MYKRCQALGLSVPRDIRLLGFDGNPLNAYLAPRLSTIRVPYEGFQTASMRPLVRRSASIGRRWDGMMWPSRR